MESAALPRRCRSCAVAACGKKGRGEAGSLVVSVDDAPKALQPPLLLPPQPRVLPHVQPVGQRLDRRGGEHDGEEDPRAGPQRDGARRGGRERRELFRRSFCC